MTKEDLKELAVNSLIGFTNKRGTAWHWREDVDNHFEGAVPRERALELLSYPLEEGLITATVLTEEGVISIDDATRKAIVRTDTGALLGVFKQGYKIHQPAEWCLQNVDLILDGGLQIGSVNVLKGGAVASLQAEMEDTRTAAEGVEYRPFLTAATSHDGSIATTYGVGSQVVVCDNTLSVALKTFESRTRIRHTSNSLARIGEVRQNLGLIVEQAGDTFDEQVQALTSEYVSDARWAEFVKAFTGVDKAKEGRSKTIAEAKVKTLNTMWTSDERVTPWRNSAWGALSAVNTSMHHEFGAEKNREERNALRTVRGEWDSLDSNTLALLATV